MGDFLKKKNFSLEKVGILFISDILDAQNGKWECGCTKVKKNFFAFLDKLSHFQQVLKKWENQKILI